MGRTTKGMAKANWIPCLKPRKGKSPSALMKALTALMPAMVVMLKLAVAKHTRHRLRVRTYACAAWAMDQILSASSLFFVPCASAWMPTCVVNRDNSCVLLKLPLQFSRSHQMFM